MPYPLRKMRLMILILTTEVSMSNKHTPGPWTTWEPLKENTIVITADDDKKAVVLANLPKWNGEAQTEAIANAILMSKSPELFKSLCEVVHLYTLATRDTLDPKESDAEIIERANLLIDSIIFQRGGIHNEG